MKTIQNLFCKAVLLFLLLSSTAFSQSIIGKIGPLGLHKFEIRNKVTPFNVYLSIDQPTGRVTINNSINLENTVEATAWPNPKGVIYKGTNRFMHNLGGTYLGIDAGNFGHSDVVSNTGIGAYSLSSNSENAVNNTAVGSYSLRALMFGDQNTAVGSNSLYLVGECMGNTALGSSTLVNNQGGNYNTAVGLQSLFNNTGIEGYINSPGSYNTAVGRNSLYNNTLGNNNSSLGNLSGQNITTGNNNTAIGYDAQVPDGTLSNQVRIGNTDVEYAGVEVDWTITSDRRAKSNINESNLGLSFISKLRPVSYTRNNDSKQRTEYGFIAQEVEEVLIESGVDNSGMITISDEGKYGMRYNDLLSPMVTAIQELKAENEELKNQIEQLKTVNEKIVKLESIVTRLISSKHTSLEAKEVNLTNSK